MTIQLVQEHEFHFASIWWSHFLILLSSMCVTHKSTCSSSNSLNLTQNKTIQVSNSPLNFSEVDLKAQQLPFTYHSYIISLSVINFNLCLAGCCNNSHFLSFSIKCKCYRPFRHCLLYTHSEPTFKNVSHKSFLSPRGFANMKLKRGGRGRKRSSEKLFWVLFYNNLFFFYLLYFIFNHKLSFLH